jgi:CIC family chloride channel protein
MPEPVGIIHKEIIAVTEYSVLIPVTDALEARPLGMLASAVAKDKGGEVFALHAVRVPPQLGIADGRYFLKQGKPILDTVIEEGQKRDVPVRTMIRLGRTAASVITKTARERGTDLMMLRWPRHTETPEGSFGSLIDLIAQDPPCDLAVVRFRKRELPRRILVATAGGSNAELAIELAISQARQFRAERGEDASIVLLNFVPDADAVSTARAERLLSDIASHYDCPLETRVVCAPDVPSGILQEGETCNLLLVGATGEGLFEQRLLGSIPERVARETTKTVIMTKRYWRLKSFLSRLRPRLRTKTPCLPPDQTPDA